MVWSVGGCAEGGVKLSFTVEGRSTALDSSCSRIWIDGLLSFSPRKCLSSRVGRVKSQDSSHLTAIWRSVSSQRSDTAVLRLVPLLLFCL